MPPAVKRFDLVVHSSEPMAQSSELDALRGKMNLSIDSRARDKLKNIENNIQDTLLRASLLALR